MAIALDHNHARAYLHLGQTLMFLGQPEAGAPHIEKAIRLNPYDPNIGIAYWALGTSYLLVGQLNEALYVHKKARAANFPAVGNADPCRPDCPPTEPGIEGRT